MKYLGIDEKVLKETNSFNTAYEITMQPKLWEVLLEEFNEKEKGIDEFLKKIGFNEEFDVLFAGAGSSEYVGNILEPILNKGTKQHFRSTPSTSIVANPEMYLKKEVKTLIVSFARSGDSPESVATVELANKLVDNVYHLFITCNPEGQLAKISKRDENAYLYLMPEGTNDKGFAMTSSLSSMLLGALLVFKKVSKNTKFIEVAKKAFEKMDVIKEIANKPHERIVVLGSGAFRGLAHELTLKVMELSRGLTLAKFDTTLGFRHGPKSIVNDKTIVFLCNSVDEYAKKYDLGLFAEMFEENIADMLVTYSLDTKYMKDVSTVCIGPDEKIECEIAAIFTYLIYGQMYAFFKSQYFNLTTDNPFPTGEVNRVVKKFEIYKY